MTTRRAFLTVGAGTVAVLGTGASAAPASAASVFGSTVEPTYDQPLGIAMEGFPTAYPVRFLQLVNQGETVNMAYLDIAPTGPSVSGRTVLLLHGKNFDGGSWTTTARALATAGHRVVVPDQIGFGRSSKPALDYGFELLAQNTVALLDHLAIADVDVVGHSMGGMLGVRFALEHPTRTRRLVLANPVGLEDYRELVPAHTTERLFADELANNNLVGIRAFYKSYVVNWRRAYERNVELRYRITLSGEYPRWALASARSYQMAYHQPVVQDLPLLRLPVLLVIGQEDRAAVGKSYATPENRAKLGNFPVLGRLAAAAIPGSRLVELPGVGHLPHLEAKKRFEREVRSFLAAGQA
ncbi:alpha/beta fold hydrolase [Streptomyces albipurpureus]|uniref:Alpha/beta hydrolase n=1 Tax=Streptomyces albipurpureus TaxID=2897419 RepID=A0ABT0UMR8_9ACTN|nr:alpha/beta hydrolase [Streptomyces sp. CWNU-1]MCM2389375.1 alpha/beta hydrolase [Streptomyces sp. CWNU-1]